MIFIPYSPALTLKKPAVITYALVALCTLVFFMQLSTGITDDLVYQPLSWNPLTMISASLAHGSLPHLLFNMIFFLAFAPPLELILRSRVHYLGIMLLLAIVTHLSYTAWIILFGQEPVPTLGFSGVVMGMIGLSAFMMPKARIRVFWWYIIMWKTLYLPAWILALGYIGLDLWTLISSNDFGGINIVSHVSGGICGYLYGYLFLKEARDDIQEELNEEIEAMRLHRQYGENRAISYRSGKVLDQQRAERVSKQEFDSFMRNIYQQVKTHRDSEALANLLDRFNLDTSEQELEEIFDRITQWGPSRTLLCFGRMIIEKLDRDDRYGRAIVFIEKCQSVSKSFALPRTIRVEFYAEMAINTGKFNVAKNLLYKADQRYGSEVNLDQCRHLAHKLIRLAGHENP